MSVSEVSCQCVGILRDREEALRRSYHMRELAIPKALSNKTGMLHKEILRDYSSPKRESSFSAKNILVFKRLCQGHLAHLEIAGLTFQQPETYQLFSVTRISTSNSRIQSPWPATDFELA